jgi:hypothetical protein
MPDIESAVERIEEGERLLLQQAYTSVNFAQGHLRAIQDHIGHRYNLNPMDSVDDETGIITRPAKAVTPPTPPTDGSGTTEEAGTNRASGDA